MAPRIERRYRSKEIGDDDDTAMRQQQQQAGWINTYPEHVLHVHHQARVPFTDVLIEGSGKLWRSEGRMVVCSEGR
jgi:hypothetical protein